MKKCLNCKFDNADAARHCERCGFTLDWSTAGPGDPPTREMPPPARSLELAIGPGEARVQAGARVALEVRVVNSGTEPASATLQIAGDVARYASVEPSSLDLAPGAKDAAVLTIAVPPATPAQTMPVEVTATLAGVAAAPITAQAALVIEAPPTEVRRPAEVRPRPEVRPPAEPRRPPEMRRPLEERPRGGTRRSGQGRNWLTALAGTVALIAVAAVLVFLLTLAGTGGSEDDLEGRSTVSRACLHAGPDFSANPRLPDGDHCLGPLKGEEVTVECSTTGTLKLSGPGDFGGRFVDADSMEVDGTPPPC